MSAARLAKSLLGSTAASRPMRPLMRRLFRTRANLVYYHFVGDTTPFYQAFSGQCNLERFDKDLRQLKTYFDLVPLTQVTALCESGTPPPAPVLAVTFDDGFDLVRSGVMEVLNHHKVKATVFLITSCIDNQNLMWRNKLSAIGYTRPHQTLVAAYARATAPHGLPTADTLRTALANSMRWPMYLKEMLVDQIWAACNMPTLQEYLAETQPYMTWQDIEAWRANGHGVGLHTHTHPVCAGLDAVQIKDEIVQPAAMLKQRFAIDALPFSYPFGIRLPQDKERVLIEDRTVHCACGIQGTVPLGSSLQHLERVGIEAGLSFPLLGKTLVKATGLTRPGNTGDSFV